MTASMKPLALLLAATAGLAACTQSPARQDGGIATPASWSRIDTEAAQSLVSGDAAKVEQRWWKSFGDPVLDRLVDQALANNKSLKLARARVEEAQAGRRGVGAELMPQVVATGGASRGNQGYATSNRVVNIAEADLQASWELDLFGKNQARLRQAVALTESQEAQRQGVMVSLLAQVARTYFDLRNDDAQIAITRENLATQQKTLDLIRAQKTGALSSGLDVERAAAQVSTTAAQLPLLQSAREVALDRLAVLLGTTPGAKDALLVSGEPLKALDSHVVVAAPARVLASRPDVKAAERQFAASIAASDSATAELYPDVSLVGLFGGQDSTPFSATPWLIGANLVQPILDFGRIQSRIDAADARQREAFLAYQETVLEALEDMENALTLYAHEAGRQHDLDQAASQNRRAVQLASQLYKAGYSGLLDLLVAQHDALEADSNLAASDAQLRKDLVAIYAAAGGGWDLNPNADQVF